MLVRYKVGEAEWKSDEVVCVVAELMRDHGASGTIKLDPKTELAHLLKEETKMEFEFGMMSDEDADIVTLSGLIPYARCIRSGRGFSEYLDEYKFEAEGFAVQD